jgi:hypothetical protein
MHQSIIVDLLVHHQFVFSEPCQDNATATGRVWHLHVRKEGAR